MTWADKPIGIYVSDAAAKVDFKRLVDEGLKFAVISIGTGLTKDDMYAQFVDEAYDANIPILLLYTPYPEIYNVSADKVISDQFAFVKTLLVNKAFEGIVINCERSWRGEETGHQATDTNISNTFGDLANKLKVYTGKKVIIRTNDNFVKTFSPAMSNWVGNFNMLLADWRVRYKIIGTNYYVPYSSGSKIKIETLGAIPNPDEVVPDTAVALGSTALAPMIPGANTPLLMWEFTGMKYIHPAVIGPDTNPIPANFILGSLQTDSLYSQLEFVPRVVIPTDDDDNGDDPAPQDPVITGNETLDRLSLSIDAFCSTWLNWKK
jgi:hypothetical protein